jgi:predicted metal-dependent enzyme (double-stranded beta helix superfamily)
MVSLNRLRDFVIDATKAVEHTTGDATQAAIAPLLSRLIDVDDWLPEDYARPDSEYYRQYLLHADPLGRFSIVSFVWGPGQKTPVHDHRVWGLVGILRGAELSTDYVKSPDGSLIASAKERLEPGQIVALSPEVRDIHTIKNAYDNRTSVSIHVYGANIGAVRRAVFDPVSGVEKPFISGYANQAVPNLWDLSREA